MSSSTYIKLIPKGSAERPCGDIIQYSDTEDTGGLENSPTAST